MCVVTLTWQTVLQIQCAEVVHLEPDPHHPQSGAPAPANQTLHRQLVLVRICICAVNIVTLFLSRMRDSAVDSTPQDHLTCAKWEARSRVQSRSAWRHRFRRASTCAPGHPAVRQRVLRTGHGVPRVASSVHVCSGSGCWGVPSWRLDVSSPRLGNQWAKSYLAWRNLGIDNLNFLGPVLAPNVKLTASLVATAGSAMSKSGPWKSRELQRTSGSHFSSILETFDIALKKLKNSKFRLARRLTSPDIDHRFWNMPFWVPGAHPLGVKILGPSIVIHIRISGELAAK